MTSPSPSTTRDSSYTDRLERLESVWWKRLLDVQRPYRWNLRRLGLGFVLDVGCGLGRNLINLGGRDAGIGVDHNPNSIAACVERGLVAFTPDDFLASPYAQAGRFDSLMLAHVLEHMPFATGQALVAAYLPYLRPGGQVALVTPQEAGYASDTTHVEFIDGSGLERMARALGLVPERGFSFPFPRPAGRVFKYNEFVLVARKP
jgi:SAM-dependent methyltransferase